MSKIVDVTPLGKIVRPWQDDHHADIQEASEKSRQLIQLGVNALSGLEVPKEIQPVLVASLWARCLEHYEAVIVLGEQGLITPAWVSLRALLETLFTIAAVSKDAEVRDLYVKEDAVQRKKLARKLREVTPPEFRKYVDPGFEKKLDDEVAASKAHSLSTKFLAERAELLDLYLVVYALLTGPAHSKIRDLQKYLLIHNGQVIQFRP